ncbi:MAG: carboxypeptidase regulatory-like domain-containing protein [Ignavibacteriales bacterium]|nr:carboxypeptidase regulatory-like domain-containing protein [Ignavibacteriales bacterium]
MVVDETSLINGINFTVIARPDSGWGWISGKVVAGIGEAAQGSFVYAVDDMDEVVAFAMTDKNGNFVLDGVAPGEYTVVPDRADYMNAVVAKAVVNTNNFNPLLNVRLENDAPSDAKDVSVVT